MHCCESGTGAKDKRTRRLVSDSTTTARMLTPRNMKYAHREALQLSSAVVALVPLSFRWFTINHHQVLHFGNMSGYILRHSVEHSPPSHGWRWCRVKSSMYSCGHTKRDGKPHGLEGHRTNTRSTSTIAGIFIAAVLRFHDTFYLTARVEVSWSGKLGLSLVAVCVGTETQLAFSPV